MEGIFYSSSAPSIQILFKKENLSLFTGGPVFRRAISNAHRKHCTQDPSLFFFVRGPFTS